MVKKVKPLFKAAAKFATGSFGKNTASLGCKIPTAICSSKLRDEYFVNATLRVIISLDPKTDDQPVLGGMEDEFAVVELTVKVNQHSINDSDITFSMSFGKNDMNAEFLQTISHANGSIYILSVTANEDGNTTEAEEPEDDSEDE